LILVFLIFFKFPKKNPLKPYGLIFSRIRKNFPGPFFPLIPKKPGEKFYQFAIEKEKRPPRVRKARPQAPHFPP